MLLLCAVLAVGTQLAADPRNTGPVDDPSHAPELQITNARIRAVVPGQDKTVGYFTIYNPRTTDIVLVRAHCDHARATEFHTTISDGNMLRMRRLEQIVVPAGKTVEFTPGSNHLMLFGIRSLGEEIEIEFTTQSAEVLPVRFRLISLGASQ